MQFTYHKFNATLYLNVYVKTGLHFLHIFPDLDKNWYRDLKAMPLSRREFRENQYIKRHTIFLKRQIKFYPYIIHFCGIVIKSATQKFVE